ncbi:uncharacterized protein L3040_008392 [Drepanopeziza brunnea f. sp. 'multigermtubi']|uniref:Uncharacterized protein n=1 Tax=Marssonina brunnea f. sp. multigermtubi (strain MB_m1) TaxID=1072389 RepID=K1XP51_MARBU|nr:uncharacterized protein MBM_07489 [Drepanopeziza brunnea f. sp. 'multigermtubi' MB_m1]EKD14259.1 hypothetical protein MBM_07489 [Drepanopeziza brunnea f. sp. 'multigermtubi' MB_m1]KAJ5035133.1 hypothetical protein L3040_008392 [Drepanopeziza brunnea f. sp. 'multigermtubi']
MDGPATKSSFRSDESAMVKEESSGPGPSDLQIFKKEEEEEEGAKDSDNLRLMVRTFKLPGPRIIHIREEPLEKTIGEWEEESGQSWPPLTKDEAAIERKSENEIENLNRAMEVRRQNLRTKVAIESGHKNMMKDPKGKLSDDGTYPGKEAYKYAHMLAIKSNSAIPLLDKKQSDLFMKNRSKIFATDGAEASTYFNLDSDTLYLRFDTLPVFAHYTAITPLSQEFPITDIQSKHRIRRLAVAFSRGHELYYGRQDGGINARCADILRHFCNVKELTVIITHFEDQPDDAHGSSDLCFMPPVDVHNGLMEYKRHGLPPVESGPFFGEPLPRVLHPGLFLISPPQLHNIRFAARETWAIPSSIEYKCMGPRSLKLKLEMAQKNYAAWDREVQLYHAQQIRAATEIAHGGGNDGTVGVKVEVKVEEDEGPGVEQENGGRAQR